MNDKKSVYGWSLLLALVTAGCTTPVPQPPPPTAEQLKMQAEIRNINASLDRIEKRLTPPKSVTLSQPGMFQEHKADRAALAKIVLPAHPSRDDCRKYVRAIIAATEGQNYFSSEDPQVTMLQKIGAKNIDLLFAELNGPMNFHLIYTINKLADPNSKKLVLQYFPQYRELVEAVERNGWAKDAKPILVSGLYANEGYVPPSWIKALASLKDPTTYPTMIRFMRTNPNNAYQTYSEISKLPGIKIEDADIKTTWRNLKISGQTWALAQFAPVAMSVGEPEALDMVMKNITHGNASGEQLEMIYNCTEYQGMPQEIQAQYNQEKERLHWDAAEKKFKAKPRQ